jgi:hypothetical protein
MIKLLHRNLKIKDKDLVISSYYEKSTFVEISKIKFIYFRRNRFRYLHCAILTLLILFLIDILNNHFEIVVTLIIGAIIIYLSTNVFLELLEKNILVVKETNNNQNKIIVLKKKKVGAKKVIETIKNFQYENKMNN